MNLNRVCNIQDWEALGIEQSPKHRKRWEIEMALLALEDYGTGAEILGVGAGREDTIFHLCNRGARVWATDLYANPGVWHNTASANMLTDPAGCSPIPFEAQNLVVQHMDMRDLRFQNDTFDGVFSSGSIEHVGGVEDIAQAAREIGRVLKPGGIASLSTEWRISGPGDGWDGVFLFDGRTLLEHIIKPSGLELVGGTLETAVSDATMNTAISLDDAIAALKTNRPLGDHIVLTHAGYVFTSVHLILTKPALRATSRKRKPSDMEREDDAA